MTVPPPPGLPACDGADPAFFTDPSVFCDPVVARAALAMCHRCPVQAWCAAAVDPIRSRADVIAAGSIFRNGCRIPYQLLVDEHAKAERLRRKRAEKEARKALYDMMQALKQTS